MIFLKSRPGNPKKVWNFETSLLQSAEKLLENLLYNIDANLSLHSSFPGDLKISTFLGTTGHFLAILKLGFHKYLKFSYVHLKFV